MSSSGDRANQRMIKLMEKFQQGLASDQDIREIDRWYDSFSNDEKYRDGLSPREQMRVRDKLFHRMNQGISQVTAKRKAHFRYGWLAAAFVVLAIAIGVYGLMRTQHKTKAPLVQSQVQPGGNKAILTLANGEHISLTNAADGQLAEQSGVVIEKEDDGQLVYDIKANAPGTDREPVYNTLSTPVGGQYQVRLPDGTKVWLNAASSLTYPTSFAAASERLVVLSGEAYFEVSPNKELPFRVKTTRQEIAVTGTHFNVRSYADEASEKTTLIEGAVTVSSGNSSEILRPGQAAIVEESIEIANADTEAVIAWKNGYFRFKGEKIEEIMRKLSRWYGIEVRYHGSISDEGYNGKISRSKSIEQVLKMLEKTREVHFKIEGRRVTVME